MVRWGWGYASADVTAEISTEKLKWYRRRQKWGWTGVGMFCGTNLFTAGLLNQEASILLLAFRKAASKKAILNLYNELIEYMRNDGLSFNEDCLNSLFWRNFRWRTMEIAKSPQHGTARDKLFRLGSVNNRTCTRHVQQEETILHAMFQCHYMHMSDLWLVTCWTNSAVSRLCNEDRCARWEGR